MRKKILLFLALVILVSSGFMSTGPAWAQDKYYQIYFGESGSKAYYYDYKGAFDVLDELNRYRTSRGLGALEMDKTLLDAAMHRALEIHLHFDHTRPSGKACTTAASEFGNPGKYIGENIAYGFPSASSVMTGWKDSPGHDRNMLNENYLSVGIGAVDGRWVQLLSFDSAFKRVKRSDYKERQVVDTFVDFHSSVVDGPKIYRIAGSDRYKTALEASRNTYKSSSHVIIASGQNFPDALSGTALAGYLDAPILLTSKDSLARGAAEEIQRLGARKAIVLGGDSVVSSGVLGELRALGLETTRLSGSNRYTTAVDIAKELGKNTGEAFLVSGASFPDALSIGSVAARDAKPILLSREDELTDWTLEGLKELGIKKLTIVGGQGVISSQVESQLKREGISFERIAGTDRYTTSLAVAKKYFGGIGEVLLVSGRDYPDALVGGYMGAINNAPIILARPNKIMDPCMSYICSQNPSVGILGGNKAVNYSVEMDIYGHLK